MGRAIEWSLVGLVVIVVAFFIVPKIMIEFGKIKARDEKPKLKAVEDEDGPDGPHNRPTV